MKTIVVIGVCTFKRPNMLLRCLSAIDLQQIPSQWIMKIVVADNDQDQTALQTLKSLEDAKLELCYLLVQERGIPQARNAVCEKARELHADWLIFIDDDEEPQQGWLLAYEAATRIFNSKVFTGPVLSRGYDHELENLFKGPGLLKRKTGTLLKRAATNNVMMSTSILEKPLELRFDNEMRFTGGSDSDFFARYVHSGGSIVLINEARVTEFTPVQRQTVMWNLSRQYRSSANRVYTNFKLLGSRETRILAFIDLFRRTIRGTFRVFTSPLYLFLGHSAFKRSFYHGLRHFAKAAGAFAGVIRRPPQPYQITDGD